MRVLAVAGSPRRDGNTDVLLDQAIAGALSEGADVEHVILSRLKVAPCRGCNRCFETGRCVVQDDFQSLYDKALAADGIMLASPVFFTNVTGHTKAFIDRFQCLWALKYTLKSPIPPAPAGDRRRSIFISTAGSSRIRFNCTMSTVRAFLDTLDAELIGSLCVNNIDEMGAVDKDPALLEKAYALGVSLVSGEEETL
jgi:hypothetical protein